MHAFRVLALLAIGACSRDGLDHEALIDPASCASCHPDQFREWSGSMHAYASDDPVFRAMNQRAQRETGGALGGLCVGCHAPMAVREGATTDGTNLDDVPRELRGVGCLFCHSVTDVEGDHNNPLVLAGDGVMRGQLRSPVATGAHASAHSPFVDGARAQSAAACGACHDVVTPAPANLAVERTYAEWQGSLFAQPATQLSCAACHMKGRDARAAEVAGAPVRRVSSHAWPGLDVATTPWPETGAQREMIAADLEPSLATKLCVTPGASGLALELTLDNISAGHAWPSGVTHARRAWVEVVATQGGEVVYENRAWQLGQQLLDADGHEVQMAWAATSETSVVLPPAVTADRQDPRFYHAVTRTYAAPVADAVSVRVWIQPIRGEVLDDLVATGDLAPELATPTTFEVAAAHRGWARADGYGCTP